MNKKRTECFIFERSFFFIRMKTGMYIFNYFDGGFFLLGNRFSSLFRARPVINGPGMIRVRRVTFDLSFHVEHGFQFI